MKSVPAVNPDWSQNVKLSVIETFNIKAEDKKYVK